jgi:hypothetical protein
MDMLKRLLHRNSLLLRKMQALANKEQVTRTEQASFNALIAEFDRNEADIKRLHALAKMQNTTGQIKRRMALNRRERRAATSCRGRSAAPYQVQSPAHGKKQVYQYEEVPTWAVPPESEAAAKTMLLFCIADLQLPSEVNVRWCNEYQEGNLEKGRLFSEKIVFTNHVQIGGCVFQKYDFFVGNAIWVNFEMDPKAIPQIVAHEARHLYQIMHRGTLKAHGMEADAEADAIQYERQALDAYTYYPSCLDEALNKTTKIIKTV